MISKKLLQEIGLNEDQISQLTGYMNLEGRYRRLLLKEKVNPGVVNLIMDATKIEEIDFSNEDLLREKIRVEYSAFIK